MTRDPTIGGKVDMVVINCDLMHIGANFERAMKLVRVGGMIAVESTLWGGKVARDCGDDNEAKVVGDFNDKIRADKRVEMCLLGISNGLTLCVRRE